jgi:hypothetical protein
VDKGIFQAIERDLSGAVGEIEVLDGHVLGLIAGGDDQAEAGGDCTSGTRSVCHVDGTTDDDPK